MKTLSYCFMSLQIYKNMRVFSTFVQKLSHANHLTFHHLIFFTIWHKVYSTTQIIELTHFFNSYKYSILCYICTKIQLTILFFIVLQVLPNFLPTKYTISNSKYSCINISCFYLYVIESHIWLAALKGMSFFTLMDYARLIIHTNNLLSCQHTTLYPYSVNFINLTGEK